MIKLTRNADTIVREEIRKAPVRAFYLSVVERYDNHFTQLFPVDLQNLLTKIGIVVSNVSTGEFNIRYCSSSIDFLCNQVLDNPRLYNVFDSLNINTNGNVGKHTIKFTNADMDKCIKAYNNIISGLIQKYGLRALNSYYISEHKSGYVKKNSVVNVNSNSSHRNYHNSKYSESIKKDKVESIPCEQASTSNPNFKMNVVLASGDGRYNKGFITKKKMINFKLYVKFANPNNYKISSVVANVKCKDNSQLIKLPNISALSSIDLPTSKYSGRIEITVSANYKLATFKTKNIKCTVSKNL